jgi:hypothetical protein
MTTADISFDIFETGVKKSRGTKSRKATYPAALRMAWLVAAKRAAQAAVSRIRNPSGRCQRRSGGSPCTLTYRPPGGRLPRARGTSREITGEVRSGILRFALE